MSSESKEARQVPEAIRDGENKFIAAWVALSAALAVCLAVSLASQTPYHPMDVFVAIMCIAFAPVGLFVLWGGYRRTVRLQCARRFLAQGIVALCAICIAYGIAALFFGWIRTMPLLWVGVFLFNAWSNRRVARAVAQPMEPGT